MYPYNFQERDSDHWLALAQTNGWNLLGAAILFLPLGYFEALLAANVLRRQMADVAWPKPNAAHDENAARTARFRLNLIMCLVVIDVAVLALIVETAQLWLPGRTSSMLDLIANTLGGTIGGLLAARRATAA